MFRTLLLTGLLAASVLPVWGQSPRDFAAERNVLREVNSELLRLQTDLRRSDLSADPAFRERVVRMIEQRAALLGELIVKDPKTALEVALPDEVLREYQSSVPSAAGKLETRGTWLGTAEYLIEDDVTLTSHKAFRRLRVGREYLDLHFAGEEPEGFETGKVLAVSGVRVGNQIAAAPDQVSMSAAAAVSCSPTGPQNVLAILVNLPGFKLSSNMNAELVKGILAGNSFSSSTYTPNISVDDFWQQSSDGKTWITKTGTGAMTVAGPFELSSNFNTGGPSSSPSCDTEGLRAAALAAVDPQVNLKDFTRILIIFPNQSGCSFAGLAYVGCASWNSPQDGAYTAGLAWQRADTMGNRDMGVKLTTHELGHTLGMSHASSRRFNGEALGPLGTNGTVSEYGSNFSTMGSWNLGFYAAPHAAQRLNWLTSGTNFQNVESSGTYTIQAFEDRPAALKALRIRRGTGNNAWLWVEYRRGVAPYTSTLSSQIFNGALIHYEDSFTGLRSHLLDFTPETSSFSDPALTVGQSWKDPYSNLSLSIESIANGFMTVKVDYGGATCTRAAPQVTLSPNPAAATAGSPAALTVNVKNNDSSGCPSNTYNLTSTQPAGWASNFSSASLNVAPGATWTSTLTVIPPSGTTGGFTVGATATAASGSASGSATVNVSAPVVPALSAGLASAASSYKLRSWMTFTATVTQSTVPVEGATVTFTLTKPNGTVTGSGRTGRDGKVTWRYRLTATDPTGSYAARIVAVASGQTANAGPISVSVVP